VSSTLDEQAIGPRSNKTQRRANRSNSDGAVVAFQCGGPLAALPAKADFAHPADDDGIEMVERAEKAAGEPVGGASYGERQHDCR
jgi:hypothetical protein